jgi:hypothetical protein
MFVGWIRGGSFESDLDIFATHIVVDKHLLKHSFAKSPNMLFGVYEEQKLQACIGAYGLDGLVYIHSLYYLQKVSLEVIERLIALFISNHTSTPMAVLAKESEMPLFEKFGFKEVANFMKMMSSSSKVAFNFSNVMAKRIADTNYMQTIPKLESICFGKAWERDRYIKEALFKSSSLVFSTSLGYQHSYAMSKNIIKISPWIVDESAYDDAEMFIRGLLYHRGLKQIVAIAPKDASEVQALYKSYKFEQIEPLVLMSKDIDLQFNQDMIYAL